MDTERTSPHRISNALKILRSEGFVSLYFRVLARTVYRRAIFLELLLNGREVAPSTDLPVTVEELPADRIHEYLVFHPETTPAEAHARLAEGQKCFVVRLERKIIHSGWAAVGSVWIRHIAQRITLAPDEVYTYESYTAPAYRGLNLAGAKIVHIARLFHAAGYRRLKCIVVPENTSGLQPVLKMGYRPLAIIGQIQIGPWRHNFWRELSPTAVEKLVHHK